MRALILLVHAQWAHKAGLPVAVSYNSSFDRFIDMHRPKSADGWRQYFAPIDQAPQRAVHLQLGCEASARLWETTGGFAPTLAEATEQRINRIATVKRLGLLPKRFLVQQANAFWWHKFSGNGKVLGVHLRGTDKQWIVPVSEYMPLINAYLCEHPDASVFVATDDQRMLEELQQLMPAGVPLIWNEVSRGRGVLNPAFHASELNSTRAPSSLGYEVMLDTLLLAKCDFLIKSNGAVSEFALYLNEKLLSNHYDLSLARSDPAMQPAAVQQNAMQQAVGQQAIGQQAAPPWAHACERKQAAAPLHGKALYESLYQAGYHNNSRGVDGSRAWTLLTEFRNHSADEYASVRTLLDVGCSHGFLVEALWGKCRCASGVDISDTAVNRAVQWRLERRAPDEPKRKVSVQPPQDCLAPGYTAPPVGENCRQVRTRPMVPRCMGQCFQQASVLQLPYPDRHFDAVMCSDVLEHLSASEAQRGVRELSRVAGRFVFVTVAERREFLNKDLNKLRVSGERTPGALHLTTQSRSFWLRLFEQAGFVLHRQIQAPWYEGWNAVLRRTGAP